MCEGIRDCEAALSKDLKSFEALRSLLGLMFSVCMERGEIVGLAEKGLEKMYV